MKSGRQNGYAARWSAGARVGLAQPDRAARNRHRARIRDAWRRDCSGCLGRTPQVRCQLRARLPVLTARRGHGTLLVDGHLVGTLVGSVERTNKLVTVAASSTRCAPTASGRASVHAPSLYSYSAETGDVGVGRVTEVRRGGVRISAWHSCSAIGVGQAVEAGHRFSAGGYADAFCGCIARQRTGAPRASAFGGATSDGCPRDDGRTWTSSTCELCFRRAT